MFGSGVGVGAGVGVAIGVGTVVGVPAPQRARKTLAIPHDSTSSIEPRAGPAAPLFRVVLISGFLPPAIARGATLRRCINPPSLGAVWVQIKRLERKGFSCAERSA